jgi:hypothetical protein
MTLHDSGRASLYPRGSAGASPSQNHEIPFSRRITWSWHYFERASQCDG